MKDWIEILIGVVVFGVLIFVHVIDHIIAFKKMLDKRKAEAAAAEAAAPNYSAQTQYDAAPPPPTPAVATPQALPAPYVLPAPYAQPAPYAVLPVPTPPKPPKQRERLRQPPPTQVSTLTGPAVQTPVISQRSSPVLPVVQEMMKDRKNLAAAFILQQVFGPPKSKRE